MDCDSSSIVEQSSQDHVEEVACNLAGWKNQDSNGSYLNVELSPRVLAKARAKQEDIIGSLIQAFYLNAFAATSGSYVSEEVRTRIQASHAANFWSRPPPGFRECPGCDISLIEAAEDLKFGAGLRLACQHG